MRDIKKLAGTLGSLLTVGALISGCGGSSSPSTLSASEFRAKGNAICTEAIRRLHAIGTPTSESQFAPYLKKTVPLAEEEDSKLAGLDPPASYSQPLKEALSQSRQTASLINGFTAKLASKQVKVSAFSGFAKQLGPLEKKINADYTNAGLTACAKEG
jgi:hypothetical protein